MTEKKYPGVLDRVKAMTIDGIVVLGLILGITYVFSLFEYVSDTAKIIAFVFIFILYDPIFTSIFGGTIGHFIFGIRVKRKTNEMKNLIFPLAILRFLVKVLLGWVSLLTVTSNEKRRAIHDYLAGTVVVYANSK
jgi:uncharacterized RDD family membrane protein YckC